MLRAGDLEVDPVAHEAWLHGELVSLIDEGEGRGITSTSPSWILFGSLICGFAATSCACVMWNLLAIRARVSPFAIV